MLTKFDRNLTRGFTGPYPPGCDVIKTLIFNISRTTNATKVVDPSLANQKNPPAPKFNLHTKSERDMHEKNSQIITQIQSAHRKKDRSIMYQAHVYASETLIQIYENLATIQHQLILNQ